MTKTALTLHSFLLRKFSEFTILGVRSEGNTFTVVHGSRSILGQNPPTQWRGHPVKYEYKSSPHIPDKLSGADGLFGFA